jgi:hypothetical protein
MQTDRLGIWVDCLLAFWNTHTLLLQVSHNAASSSGGAFSAWSSEAAYVLASSATILFNKHCLR